MLSDSTKKLIVRCGFAILLSCHSNYHVDKQKSAIEKRRSLTDSVYGCWCLSPCNN